MNKVITFLMSILILSCTNHDKEQNRFISPKNLVFPEELFSFFPTNENLELLACYTSAEKMELPYVPSEFSITYYTEIYKCEDDVYNRLKNVVKSAAIRDVDGCANNYFIIEDERYLISRFDTNTLKELYSQTSIESLLISFHSILDEDDTGIYDSSTLTGLSNDFNIAILKSGNDFIITDTIYKYNWDVLSERNKHGYIGGVAYSDKRKILIYTIVAW